MAWPVGQCLTDAVERRLATHPRRRRPPRLHRVAGSPRSRSKPTLGRGPAFSRWSGRSSPGDAGRPLRGPIGTEAGDTPLPFGCRFRTSMSESTTTACFTPAARKARKSRRGPCRRRGGASATRIFFPRALRPPGYAGGRLDSRVPRAFPQCGLRLAGPPWGHFLRSMFLAAVQDARVAAIVAHLGGGQLHLVAGARRVESHEPLLAVRARPSSR